MDLALGNIALHCIAFGRVTTNNGLRDAALGPVDMNHEALIADG